MISKGKEESDMNRSPESSYYPENRVGTKTYRGYMAHMINGNFPSGNIDRTMIHSSLRMYKKARKLVESGVHWKDVPGRTLRRLTRAAWVNYGDDIPSVGY